MLKESKAKPDPRSQPHLGGMRNPAEAAKGMPAAMSLGLRIYARWERFCKDNPQALQVAETELKRLVGVRGRPQLSLSERWRYDSTLEWGIIQAWVDKSGDPDVDLASWARDGVPMGINRKIATRGVFPLKEEASVKEEYLADALAQISGGQVANYTSVQENKEDAKGEVERLISLGYAERITEQQVRKHFSQGTVSKLGVVVKPKDDGSKKVRLVIDMRRSGGNDKAELPERLVLPRVWDAVEDMKRLRRCHPQEPSGEERKENWAQELVMVDISDAFPHFKVDQSELEHCITPDVGREGYLLFKAMLFGSKCAPLLWSRLAAWVARALHTCLPAAAGSQMFLDDTLWTLMGTLRKRNVSWPSCCTRWMHWA